MQDIDIEKIENLEELRRLKELIYAREKELIPNHWVKMVDNQVKLTLRTIKKLMDDGQFEPNKTAIEKTLLKLSPERYEEEARKEKALRRGHEAKEQAS